MSHRAASLIGQPPSCHPSASVPCHPIYRTAPMPSHIQDCSHAIPYTGLLPCHPIYIYIPCHPMYRTATKHVDENDTVTARQDIPCHPMPPQGKICPSTMPALGVCMMVAPCPPQQLATHDASSSHGTSAWYPHHMAPWAMGHLGPAHWCNHMPLGCYPWPLWCRASQRCRGLMMHVSDEAHDARE